jgi:hypothetical protein
VSHFDLANEPFQLIICPWQAFNIVAGEQASPEAAEDLIDVLSNLPIFSIVIVASDQVNQIVINSLFHAGAGFGWLSLGI